jgi:hypothetical protein
MKFRKLGSGMHCHDPRDDGNLVFNAVTGNMELVSKRQVKGAETTLSYPSLKDFKWVMRGNQIKNCSVTVENANVAERKDHSEETASGGKGHGEGPYESVAASQGGVHDARCLFCQQHPVFSHSEPENMLHGSHAP